MNVTFLSSSISRNAGGIFESQHRLARALQQKTPARVEVMGLEDENAERDRKQWAPLSPQVFQVWGPRLFGYAPELESALLGSNTDLVHLHGLWMYPSLAVLRWARKTGRPHVITPHGMLDSWARENAGWKKAITGWLYENDSLREAACLHALNTAELRAIREYGLTNPVCVIPNGVKLPETEGGRPPPWDETVSSESKTLLFLGRIHPKKGLEVLIEAWSEMHKSEKKDWKLVIVGWDDGGYEGSLVKKANKLNLKDVYFNGPCFGADKVAAFTHSDAFVLPSFSEGLPMTVLEAWSYGLPVAMTTECNLPEGFEAGAAMEVKSEPKELADALSCFLASPREERERMGKRGRELVEKRFTWPNIARRMNEVYKWVLEGGSSPEFVYM